MMKTISNKNLRRVSDQIENTLDQMFKLGYVWYYDIPKFEKNGIEDRITWNNHIGGRTVSGKYFLRINQYLEILSSKALIAILSDYSLIRCAFSFIENKLVSETLLWWPCPVIVDESLVEYCELKEIIEMILEDKEVETYIRMRSPIRIDFDVKNDNENHPGAHLHMEHEECRISTDEPICFNRFMNYIVKSFYPGWDVKLKKSEYIKFSYDRPKYKILYNNGTKILIE